MAGWLFIILCALCSILIAHFFKIIEHKKLSTIRVLTINYAVAALAAFVMAGRYTELPEISTEALLHPVLLAMVVGVIFIVNFFIYSKSVYHNGVGISVAAMRISLIVPVLLSILIYLEVLSSWQWAGIFLVFITLFLLLPDKRKMLREPFSVAWLLVLLFILTGFGDASLKIYEEEFSGVVVKEHFMGVVFLTAFFAGLAGIIVKKKWLIKKEEWLMGLLIGLPNLLTAIFLIEALERLPGAVVYSAVNVLTVLGGTLLGILRWGDRFTTLQWTGIFLALFAILFLI